MNQVILAISLFAVSCAIAFVLRRRRPEPPTQSESRIPEQVDRNDFADPDKDWLIVSFTSEECDSCASVAEATALVESKSVALDVVSVQDRPRLHDRYHVTQIPLTLICNSEGVVTEQFVGPIQATHLWSAMASSRS